MKRTLLLIIVIFVAVCLLATLTSCGESDPEDFEENICGIWESVQDDGPHKASVGFELQNGCVFGTFSFYEHESGEWKSETFTLGERTDYTLTFFFFDGSEKKVSYSMGKDTLVLDGVVYKNDDKNVGVDEDLNTYVFDGVPMPIRDAIYFGMSKTELMEFESAQYMYEDSSGLSLYYSLPDDFEYDADGYVIWDLDAESRELCGYKIVLTMKDVYLLVDVLNDLSARYGRCDVDEYDGGAKTSYTYHSGNIEIKVWEIPAERCIKISYYLE